jgi:hypothetical protein
MLPVGLKLRKFQSLMVWSSEPVISMFSSSTMQVTLSVCPSISVTSKHVLML